jgi:transcriptional regulator with XRE-family HTH domain
LGPAIGITFQQIQKYEKGTNRIGASRLQQIADVLKVPVGWFFEGQPGRAEGAPRRGRCASPTSPTPPSCATAWRPG